MKISDTGPVQTIPVRHREKPRPASGSGFAEELHGEALVGAVGASAAASPMPGFARCRRKSSYVPKSSWRSSAAQTRKFEFPLTL